MSDFTHTPTRQMAQSAMMKAGDAYAAARQALSRIEALEQQLADRADEAAAQIRALKARIQELEPPEARAPRRKVA